MLQILYVLYIYLANTHPCLCCSPPSLNKEKKKKNNKKKNLDWKEILETAWCNLLLQEGTKLFRVPSIQVLGISHGGYSNSSLGSLLRHLIIVRIIFFSCMEQLVTVVSCPVNVYPCGDGTFSLVSTGSL